MTRDEIYDICNRYESGYGHGLNRDGLDLSKTPHSNPDEGMAYQIGYEQGYAKSCNKYDSIDWDELADSLAEAIDWDEFTRTGQLSMGLIRRYQHKVNWHNVSKYQRLTEEFIDEFQDTLDWLQIFKYQHVTPELIQKFQDRYDAYLKFKEETYS